MSNTPPSVSNILPNIIIGDTFLVYSKAYGEDGVTLATPTSATCTITNLNTATVVENASAGSVGLGFASFSWDTTGLDSGPYYIELKITFSPGNSVTETYFCNLAPAPISFSNDLSTDIGMVRVLLGDDILSKGIRPGGENFSDDAIQAMLTREGSVNRALASICEINSRIWSSIASITVGARSEQLAQISENWRKRALELRELHGYGDAPSSIEAGVIQLGFAETLDG